MPTNSDLLKSVAVIAISLSTAYCAAQSNIVVVVTASRLDSVTQDVLRVPGDVSVIDSAAISRSRARNIPDLLRSQGNVFMRSSNGKGSTGELSMRGFGENSGPRVLVIVDGHKMNRADMGIQDWQSIPLDEIESIEILRGGQSVLYGNHALSGVIKITTKKGGTEVTKLKASAGSYGFQEYGISHNGYLDALCYDVGLNYQRDQGYRDNSLSWSKNANASLSYDLTAEDTTTLRFSGGENYYQLPGPLTYKQYKQNPEQSSNSGDQDTQTDSGLITALYEGERDWGKMQLNAGINMRNIDWVMSGMSGLNKQRGYSLSPKILFGDEDDLSVSGGLDLLYDTLDFTGENDVSVNYAELNRFTTGPFILVKKKFFDSLTLSSGARYEHARTHGENVRYNKADMAPEIDPPYPWLDPIPNPDYPPKPVKKASYNDAFTKEGWSYEASILWEATDALSLWCRYNRVYRYPALDESASYQGYPLADPLNEDLDPETADNFEVGSKLRYGSWSASATCFYMIMDDEISYDDNRKLNLNIGETDRLGTNLEIVFERAGYGASFMAEVVSARFTGGKNEDEDVPLVPDAHGVTSLWVEPLANLRFTGSYTWTTSQYQGGDFDNQSRQINGYGIFGARADLTLQEQLSLFVKAENILDKEYASSAYNGGWYPGMGRAVYAGASFEF